MTCGAASPDIKLKGAESLQIGFKMFLNVTPTVTNWAADNKQFSLIFEENPLADFVELPDDGHAQDELWYSNILCGVLRGALEMVRSSFPQIFDNVQAKEKI